MVKKEGIKKMKKKRSIKQTQKTFENLASASSGWQKKKLDRRIIREEIKKRWLAEQKLKRNSD